MKKLFFLGLALAAMTLTSCGKKDATGEAKSEEKTEETTPANFTVSESEKFSIAYPDIMKETLNRGNVVNASSEDGSCRIDATFNDHGPAISELNKYAENYPYMIKSLDKDATIEKANIQGNVLTIKSISEGEVNLHFVVMKEDKIGIAGSLKCKEDKISEYEKYLKPIMNSIKFK